MLGRYDGAAGLFVASPPLIAGPASGAAGLPLLDAGAPGPTVRAYLNQLRDAVQRSYSYQDFPVAALAHKLHGERRATNVGVRFDGLHEAWASADYDLSIEIRHRERYEIVLTGRPTVFTLHYLQHLARHLRNVVAGFGALDAPLDTISLLDDEERARLRSQAASVAVDGTFLEQFAQRVAAAPDSVAVVTADASLTYAELDDRRPGWRASCSRNTRSNAATWWAWWPTVPSAGSSACSARSRRARCICRSTRSFRGSGCAS